MGQFYKVVFTIEYQKQGLLYIYFLPFFHPEDPIFDIAKIDKIIFIKLPTKKDDPIEEIFDILLLVMLYDPYRNQYLNALYIEKSNHGIPKRIKQYFRKFLPQTIIYKNGYLLYCY